MIFYDLKKSCLVLFVLGDNRNALENQLLEALFALRVCEKILSSKSIIEISQYNNERTFILSSAEKTCFLIIKEVENQATSFASQNFTDVTISQTDQDKIKISIKNENKVSWKTENHCFVKML